MSWSAAGIRPSSASMRSSSAIRCLSRAPPRPPGSRGGDSGRQAPEALRLRRKGSDDLERRNTRAGGGMGQPDHRCNELRLSLHSSTGGLEPDHRGRDLRRAANEGRRRTRQSADPFECGHELTCCLSAGHRRKLPQSSGALLGAGRSQCARGQNTDGHIRQFDRRELTPLSQQRLERIGGKVVAQLGGEPGPKGQLLGHEIARETVLGGRAGLRPIPSAAPRPCRRRAGRPARSS